MFILFLLVWLILVGSVTAETVIFGVVLAGVLYLFMYKFAGLRLRSELRLLKASGYILAYPFVLLWEILKANASVASVILKGKRRTDAAIVRKTIPLHTRSAITVLANSITLTPGTITVSADGNVLTVHCLRREFADSIDNWILLRMLRRIERITGYDR